MKENDITPIMVASVPFLGGCVALAMVIFLNLLVGKSSSGSGKQVEISKQIKSGARAFLRTEYTYLAVFVTAVAAFIVLVLELQPDPPREDDFDLGREFEGEKGGWQTMICFIIGALLSAIAGWGGMMIATTANVKTMEAARRGLNPALRVAFAGGAVMGFTVVSLGLLGVSVLFFIFAETRGSGSTRDHMNDAVRYLSGFGFGASAIALFARVAGGIFTKAADVGADLVGKVEAGIPEDDPRNPATIADCVGDNVGDTAGMGADLFESFVGSIIAAATLASSRAELALPFWIAGFGVVCALIGYFAVRTKDGASQKQLLLAIHSGMYLSSLLVCGTSAAAVIILFNDNEGSSDNQEWKHFGCVLIGLVSGMAIGEATEYFTSYAYGPVQSITAAGAMGGAATVIIQGLGMGMLSCVPPVIIIVAAVLGCAELSGVYGVAIAAVGMLSTLGVTLATDAYGPVADNAGGIAEMSPDCPEEVRERTDKLDALGNTTAATGKGFAIGSAVLTSLALMNAYSDALDNGGRGAVVFDLTEPVVLAGTLLGAMLPYLFAALTMLSVRKAAASIIGEVQRQFREITGLMEGTTPCDSNACVALCTSASVKEMMLPGIFAVMAPITVGLLVGAKCLGGMLIGAISSGFLLAVMMSNAGGAWDNSKKYIENEKVWGGKKSDVHTACVVGDTVGDPFKDTSGPALNILIKLMSIISLTLAPIFDVKDWDTWIAGLIALGVMFVLAGVAYYFVWHKTEEGPVANSTRNPTYADEKARESIPLSQAVGEGVVRRHVAV